MSLGCKTRPTHLSVKVIASGVDFPIDVYSTIIVRDSIDYQCINSYTKEKGAGPTSSGYLAGHAFAITHASTRRAVYHAARMRGTAAFSPRA